MRKRAAILLSGILAAIAMVIAGCGGNGDAAVAVVNDEEITETELQTRMDAILPSYEMQLEAQGQEVDEAMLSDLEQQILDDLINQAVLRQTAEREGFSADEAEVEAEYQQIRANVEAQGMDLDEAMEAEGLTEETLREEIATHIAVEAYLDHEFEQAGVQVDDADVQALYDEYSEMMDDIPPYEEIEGMLRQELEQQQQGEVFQQIIDRLRQESEIQVLL